MLNNIRNRGVKETENEKKLRQLQAKEGSGSCADGMARRSTAMAEGMITYAPLGHIENSYFYKFMGRNSTMRAEGNAVVETYEKAKDYIDHHKGDYKPGREGSMLNHFPKRKGSQEDVSRKGSQEEVSNMPAA